MNALPATGTSTLRIERSNHEKSFMFLFAGVSRRPWLAACPSNDKDATTLCEEVDEGLLCVSVMFSKNSKSSGNQGNFSILF